jgi:hypothetical protein
MPLPSAPKPTTAAAFQFVERREIRVHNLFWWTSDASVIESLNSIGVYDVIEVVISTNPTNGASSLFGIIAVASKASHDLIAEKLPQTPVDPTESKTHMYAVTLMNARPAASSSAFPPSVALPAPNQGKDGALPNQVPAPNALHGGQARPGMPMPPFGVHMPPPPSAYINPRMRQDFPPPPPFGPPFFGTLARPFRNQLLLSRLFF